MTKKIVASAGVLAAITVLVTGITYAGLNTRTESVVNNFQGACVNIGVVEKDINGDTVVLEDAGTSDTGSYDEKNNNNTNIYDKMSEDERTAAKKVAVKNVNSADYPTTDTMVRVRFVPALVYDDSDINRRNGVAGQIVPVDMRDKVEYVFADDVVSYESFNVHASENAADNDIGNDTKNKSKKWVYTDSSTGDINDRYYYYMSALAPGEVSETLLESVIYTGELPDNTHFELRVLSEGIAEAQLEYMRGA